MRSGQQAVAFGLALIGSAAATPGNKLPLFCDVVRAVVTVAQNQASATAFCSSYLGIPLSTKTTTTTVYTSTSTVVPTTTVGTTTSTAPAVTVTTTTTLIIPTTTTLTETDTTTTGTTTVPTIASITSCVGLDGATKKKRANMPKMQPKPKPNCLNTYKEGAALTSACKCLSITPSTTTVTSTKQTSTTITSTSSVTVTVMTTPTTTSTVTETDRPQITETSTTTTSVEATSTSGTSFIFAIPTFKVQVNGGDNSGDWFAANGQAPTNVGNYYLDESNAGLFSLDANGHFIFDSGDDSGDTAVEDTSLDPSDPYIVWAEGPGSTTSNAEPLVCTVSQNTDGTCPLACTGVDGGTTNYDCGAWWRVAPSLASGCSLFTPLVVGHA